MADDKKKQSGLVDSTNWSAEAKSGLIKFDLDNKQYYNEGSASMMGQSVSGKVADQYNLINRREKPFGSAEVTNNEKEKFFALYNESPSKANAYAQRLNRYYQGGENDAIQAWAGKNPVNRVIANVGSLAAMPLQTGMGLAETANAIIRPNDPYRETNLNSYLNPGALSSNLRAGARYEGEVLGTLDDIVYTTAQSLIAQGMTGGMGSLLLSGNVLESSYRENRNAGMSSEQAMVTSAVMAGISYITEHMGTDQVFDRMSRLAPLNAGTKTVVASTVKQLLSAFLSEGIEEGAEGLLDNAAEVILDRLYGTDYSTFATKKAELIAKGMSDDEATKQAIYSIAQEIGKEMLMGGASGLLGGGAVSVASNIRRNAINNKMYNQAVENNRLGGDSGLISTLRNSTDADVSAMAQNLNENSKKRDIGKAINVQMGAIERDAIATSLSNRGMETQQAQNLAEAIRADNAHEILTNEQRELLKQNKDVVKSINNDIKREAPWVQRMYATQGAFYEGFDTKVTETNTEQKTETKAEEPTKVLTQNEANFKRAFGIPLAKNETVEEVTSQDTLGSYAKANNVDLGNLAAGFESVHQQNPMITAERYVNSLDLAYDYGRMGITLEKLTNALAFPVNEAVNERYEQGMKDGLKSKSESVIRANERKKGYSFRNDGKAKFATENDIKRVGLNYAWEITDKDLNDKQKAEINFWTRFYEGSKYRLLFYASDPEKIGSQEGAFTELDGKPTVLLDINAPMIRKGTHEFVHALRFDNPALYEELKSYVIEKSGRDIIKEAREQKAREDYARAKAAVEQGQIESINDYKSPLDLDTAVEELIARYCENVFDDVEAVAEIYQRKPSLWNAIKDFFENLLSKLKEVIAGYGRNNKYAEELAQDIDAVERVRSILLKGRAMAINNETQQEIVENSIPVDVSTDTVQGEDTKVANMSVADEMEDLTEIDMLAPYSVEWDRGILMDGEDTPTMYSTRAGIEALGFGYDITEDNGLKMLSIKTADGTIIDKDTSVSRIENIISKQDSPMNRLFEVSQSKGLTDDAQKKAAYSATAQFIHSALVYGQDPVSGKDKLDAIWKWAGSDVFRAIKPNSDKQYGTSNDMQTVCKKTEQVLDSISEYQVKAKRGVSPGEVMRIYLETGKNGYQTPCPFCYVFSHWIRMGLLYETAASAEDHYMAKLTEKNGINDLEWWKKEYARQKEFADKNSKTIADAKADLEDIERMIDQFARPLADAVRNNDTEAVNRIQEIVDRLNTRYIAAYKLASASDYAGWIKNCILNIPRSGLKDATAYGDYKLVNRDILFDFRRADELVRDYPALARFRTSKGSAGGKAVENYADNKFGEVIAGVATDGERDADNKLLNYFKGNGTKEEFEKQFDSARKRIAKQNLRGGQRFFSWSDNRIDTGIDMLFNFIQFSALGSAVQSYTKQIEGLELIASVGGYCNASLVGKGIGFRNAKYDDNGKVISGELVFSNIQGINAETTFELNRRYDKAGNILVGMNDTHIALALGDDRIFFVIPWHRSGLSNDLLFRMMAMLGEEYVSEGKGSDSDATDYSNYQEEKSYSKHMDGTLEKYKGIPTTVTDLFKKIEGMSAQGQTARDIRGFDRVTVENGKLSDSQIAYRKLRAKVMTGKSLTEEEKQWVIGDEYLTRLQDSMRRNEIESWGTDDIDSIYPYEYWDTNSIYANADRNGVRYLEYCRRLGVQPKFCGINNKGEVKGVADFTELPGYWKVLVDRRMYDTKGRYQGLTPISLVNKGSTQRGFLNELITPEGIKAREEEYAKMGLDYKVTRLADAVGARKIADRVRTSMGDLYNIDRASDGETALAEYKASVEDVDLNKVAPQSKFSTRDYFDTEETKTLTEDSKAGPLVNTLINTIKGAGNTFSPKAFYDFYTENPEYDFVARIQEGDGNAAFELADILAKMDSVQMVDDLKWYAVESHPLYRDLHTGKDIRNSNGDIATFAQTHRKGIREFRRLCDERIEQLKSQVAHGENLGIKNMTDMPLNEVKDLFDRLNSNVDIQKLADKVFGVAKDLNLAVVFSNGAFSGTNRVGYYHGNRSLTTGRNGLVALKTSLFNDKGTTNQQKATVILHEMIHAVTSSLLYTPALKRTHFDVSVKTQNAIDAFNGLYRRLIRSTATSKFKSTYGLTNTHEFVAELANPEFRDELANAQVADINPYVESLRYIGDLVGLDGSANLRDNTLAVLDNFIDNFYADIDAYREMSAKRMYSGNANVPKYSIRYNDDGSVTVDGISAFSGGGTIDYMLGDMVSHIFAAEYDEQIAAVYEANNGIKAQRDILDDKTLEELKNIKESIEYAHFSPVCTNVSLANNKRKETAKDIEFAHKVAEWIDAKKPLALTVENVPQYANTQSAKIIIEALKRNGYNYKMGIYNSVDFGGDMSRDRFFIRALLHGEVPEVVKTGRTTKGWFNAVKDLIPSLKQSETSKQAMNKGAVYTKNYIPAWMKERLDAMKINYKNPAKPLFVMGTGDANGLVRVYEADKPIGSVKAKVGEPKIILTNGKVLDVSPAVIARLMGIPDSFELPSAKTRAFKILGNGVPGQLSRAMAVPLIQEVIRQDREQRNESQAKYSTREAPVFYSQMARTIDGLKANKFDAKTVINMLLGKGVKAEEIKWSGIVPFLEGKKSVTKQELLDFANNSMLDIQEERLTERSYGMAPNGMGESIDYIDSLRDELSDQIYNMLQTGEITDDEANEAYDTIEVEHEGDKFTASMVVKGRRIEKTTNFDKMTRWDEYTLARSHGDDAQNYREILFKMPHSQFSNGAMNGHWNRTGVLAHARVDDETLENGEKALFIEEIQSDWHNAGATEGYRSAEEEKAIASAKESQREIAYVVDDFRVDEVNEHSSRTEQARTKRIEKFNKLMKPYGYEVREIRRDPPLHLLGFYDADGRVLIARNVEEEKDFYGSIHRHFYGDPVGAKTPDAPFKNGKYVEFVLKRLLREAADNGYDYIAWTTASQQSERWSDEYAEGYRIEYDQDMPKFLNKYGKQWGAKVGKVRTENGDEVWGMPITPAMKESVQQGQPMYSLRTFEDGVRFVDVQANQKDFDGLSIEEQRTVATKIIRQKFMGRVIGIDNRAFVNSNTIHEYRHPVKRLPDDVMEAKLRAASELDNLLDAGSNFRTEPDGKDGHTHSLAVGDFRYFDTIFKVGNEYYKGVINIMPIARGLLLKDITKIENITQDINDSYGKEPKTTFLRDVSMNRISQKGTEVNPQAQKNLDQTEPNAVEDVKHFSVRTAPAPEKTVPVYKLMRYENGNLYPLYIDNSVPVDIGVWYDADSPKITDIENLKPGFAYKIDSNGNAVESKPIKGVGQKASGLPNKNVVKATAQEGARWIVVTYYKNGDKAYYNVGVNGSDSSALFAMRPGWHAGSLPSMQQIGKGPKKNLRDDSHVWVIGEMSADKDYQAEADSFPTKDIPTHLPTDGYYTRPTNPNAKAAQSDRISWYIGGSFKVNRIISDAEARSVIDNWNAEHPNQKVDYDFQRESGRVFDGEKLVDAKYSTREYSGTAHLTEERVDQYLEQYAIESNPHKSKAWIALMNPGDFMYATSTYSDMFRIPKETEEFDLDRLKRESQPIFLDVEVDSNGMPTKITGHEGRHRTLAMSRVGVYRSPVILVAKEYAVDRPGFSSKWLTGQSRDSKQMFVFDAIPLDYAHRDEIIEKFSKLSGTERLMKKYEKDYDVVQFSTRTELSNYEILAETLDSNLQSQADKDALKMYKASYNEALKIRARLDELNTLLREETHPAVQHNYQTQINELRKSLRKREEILDKVLTKPRIASLVAKQKADIQKLEGYLMDEQMTHQEDVEALRKRLGKLGDKIVQQNERFRAYRARMAENKGINYYRPRIEKVAKSLSEQLNTTLPIPFRQPIAGVLSLLDFTTKKDGNIRGGKANFDRQVAQAQFAKMAQDASDPYKFFSEYGIDISPDFADWVREIQQWFADATSGMTTMDVRAMDSYQLQSLYRFLKNIDTQAKKATKMYQAKATSVKELGENTMIHLEPLAVKEQGKLQGVSDFFTWTNAQPVTAFDRFGESGKKLFEAFADSQDQLAWDNKAIRDFCEELFKGKDITGWRENTKTVQIGDEKVTAPIAFWMEMYCYLNQEDSYRHLIEGGGFRMKDYKEKGKTITDTDRFMTEEDLIAIEEALTQEQKETALAMKKYMAETGSEWGNAISRVRFGIDQFGSIKDYYPIKTIRSETQEAKLKEEDGGNLYALMNKSWTKGRVMNAKNALVVGDIFETFAKHMGEMATYHSFALSTLDTIKWLNYKSNELSDDDKIREKSVQGAMKQAYGNAAPKYIFDFLDSVNGTAQAKDDTPAMRLVGAKNRIAVGANFRVMVQQPLSLARAFSEINPKYFVSGFNFKQTYDEMMRYGGIAEWKANGHFETNISRSVLEQIAPDAKTKREQKITDITMKGAEWGDRIAWVTMWNAVKNEVTEQNPNLKGEDLMKKVNERFRDIIYRTQVVDSTLTRSAYMRKKDYFHRITSSFKSEPTATLNMLIRAMDAFRYDSRRYGKQNAWMRNKKLIGTTLMAFAVTQILNAAVTAIIDAFRDDDDYETWLEKWISAFKGNAFDNFMVLNSVPYVADIFSLLQGYTPGRPDLEIVSSLISTSKQLWSSIQKGSMSPKTIFNVVNAAAYGFGIPLQNAMRDVIGFYNGTIGILYDLKITDSTSAKFQMSPETNKSGYTAFYSALKDNRTERALSLLTEMADNGLDAKKIYSGTYNLVKEEYQAGRISKEDAIKYVRMIVEFTGIERTDKQINDLVDGW